MSLASSCVESKRPGGAPSLRVSLLSSMRWMSLSALLLGMLCAMVTQTNISVTALSQLYFQKKSSTVISTFVYQRFLQWVAGTGYRSRENDKFERKRGAIWAVLGRKLEQELWTDEGGTPICSSLLTS